MKSPNIENTGNLALKDYFKLMDDFTQNYNDIETLTTIFTNENYSTSKPYLIWRELEPKDKRFEKIYLIYEENEPVVCIRWKFKINLGELIDIFGQPYVSFVPFADATYFTFQNEQFYKQVFQTFHEGDYSHKYSNDLVFDFLKLELNLEK